MKIVIAVVAALVGISIFLVMSSHRQIHTEIEIEAPAANVWAILTDFEAYADWNPFVKNVSGEASAGTQLSVTVQPEGGEAMDFKPTVLKAEENQELRWLGRVILPNVFDGEHYFIIKEISESKVKLVHGENFKGILVPLMWGGMEEGTQKGFSAMNAALKAKVETEFRPNQTELVRE